MKRKKVKRLKRLKRKRQMNKFVCVRTGVQTFFPGKYIIYLHNLHKLHWHHIIRFVPAFHRRSLPPVCLGGRVWLHVGYSVWAKRLQANRISGETTCFHSFRTSQIEALTSSQATPQAFEFLENVCSNSPFTGRKAVQMSPTPGKLPDYCLTFQ